MLAFPINGARESATEFVLSVRHVTGKCTSVLHHFPVLTLRVELAVTDFMKKTTIQFIKKVKTATVILFKAGPTMVPQLSLIKATITGSLLKFPSPPWNFNYHQSFPSRGTQTTNYGRYRQYHTGMST